MKNNTPPIVRGVAMILAASSLFAFMFTLPKLADVPINGLQVTFIRYATGFLCMLPIALIRAARGFSLATGLWPLIGLRAMFGIGTVTSVVYATGHMRFADAMAIGFADGIFVLLLAMLVLGERVSARRWAAAGACLAGALLVAQPSPELIGRIWFEPVAAVAFLGAFFNACEVIAIKNLVHRVSAVALLLYTNGLAAALLIGPAIWIGGWPEFGGLWIYGLMGPIAIAGQFLFVYALRLADVSALAPYKYSTLVFSAVFGVVLFGQRPSVTTVLGAMLIIASGIRLSQLEARA